MSIRSAIKEVYHCLRVGTASAVRFAILTCMDARLDPARYAGLSEGDAHVISVTPVAVPATPEASDRTIRLLVISHKLLGTNEWL